MINDIDAVPPFEWPKSTPIDITNRLTVDFSVKVGIGGHSDVYRGILDPTGAAQPVAVKKYRFTEKQFLRDRSVNKRIKAEMDLWRGLKHPNILRLYGLHFADEPASLPSFVSPWCDGGTMLDHIRSAREPYSSGDLALLRTELDLLQQVASGLAYLHGKNIIHGDVKSGNVLICNGVAVLGDFGYSIHRPRLFPQGPQPGPYSMNCVTSGDLGTQRWYAPESIAPKAHRSMEADVWALGCVILESHTLKEPYSGLSAVSMLISLHKGDRLPYRYPDGMNLSLWDLATTCWSRTPTLRPQARVIETCLRRLSTIVKVSSTVADRVQTEYKSSGSVPSYLVSLSRINLQFPRDLDPVVIIRRVTTALRYQIQDEKDTVSDPAVVQSIARAIEIIDPVLAETLMANFGVAIPVPSLDSSLTDEMKKLSCSEPRSSLRRDTSVCAVAFLPDGQRVVSSSTDGTLRISDVETGKTVIGPLQGHSDIVRCVAVHGSRIASCSGDGTFCVWDAESGALVLGPITAHDGNRLKWIAYSRDGTRIAIAGNHRRVTVRDANTGVQLREMVGHTSSVWCVAFSKDGTRLVSGSSGRTIRIWDVASGKGIGKLFTRHKFSITAVCFSLDDRRIFSSSADGTIHIWDAEMRALIVEPLRTDSWVECMALSPDGKRLVSGSRSGKIAMWDAQTGAAVPMPFKDHKGWVLSVAFSPDGRKIASASLEDETIALWDATDDWKRWDIDDEDVEKDDD